MIVLLQLVFITFLCVMALKIVLSKDMLLENLGNWLELKAKQNKIYDLFICPYCMNTLQSITAHAFAFGLKILPLEFNWQLLIRWPLVVFGASILSGNFWNLYETINRIKEKNESETEYYERCNNNDEIDNYEKTHN